VEAVAALVEAVVALAAAALRGGGRKPNLLY